MTLQEFVDSLGIPTNGEYINNKYVLEYDNSDDFSDVFNTVSLNKELTCDDNSVATNERALFVYSNGYFEVVLQADYDNDIYSVTVEER